MKRLLDLDSIATWHQDFSELVYADKIWSQIEAIQNSIAERELLASLTYSEDRLKNGLARQLRMKAKEILLTHHDSVIAYHGCRPRDPSSYYNYGIRGSDKESLIQEAKDIFGDISGVDQAVRDIGHEYFAHNSGKVYLYYSTHAIKQGWESHVEGSESIRCIAKRLGPKAELQYASTGKPILIKCAIPIEWIGKDEGASIVGYAGRIIEGLIIRRLRPEEDHTGFPGVYYLTRTIPPNLIEFIDVSGSTQA